MAITKALALIATLSVLGASLPHEAIPVDSDIFMHSARCAECHSTNPASTAMRTKLGDDVSPHGTWQATMMANSFRDPYWRAQVSKEVARNPKNRAAIEGLCTRCHAPMLSHDNRLDGEAPPSIEDCEGDPLAEDGVSCTVCHQARWENLGKAESFSGQLDIREGKQIYGPYKDLTAGMMRMRTDYTARYGSHIKKSALCGSCHTLITSHVPGAKPFHEQSPYLEWRNSDYSDEVAVTETSRSCQDCHMVDVGTTRIARHPSGTDLFVAKRENVRAHAFVGGNAFMLDLFAQNHQELYLDAEPEAFARTAQMTRRQLAYDTAKLTVSNLVRKAGELHFDVTLENLCGHKFPSAYPSRRAWLQVLVRRNGESVFLSGEPDVMGKIQGVKNPLEVPHYDVITDASQVQIYEMVAADGEGRPTTYLTEMAKRMKDNRLLPRGWKADGPHADATAPVGLAGDKDFVGGRDTVHYRVKMPEGGRVIAYAWLRYQTIPPVWVDSLRSVKTDEAERFVEMYDKMPKAPETVGSAFAREQ